MAIWFKDTTTCMPPVSELEYVDRVKVMDLKPTDVLVIEYPGVLSQECANQIKRHIETVFDGRRCVVLSEGATLKVASTAEST